MSRGTQPPVSANAPTLDRRAETPPSGERGRCVSLDQPLGTALLDGWSTPGGDGIRARTCSRVGRSRPRAGRESAGARFRDPLAINPKLPRHRFTGSDDRATSPADGVRAGCAPIRTPCAGRRASMSNSQWSRALDELKRDRVQLTNRMGNCCGATRSFSPRRCTTTRGRAYGQRNCGSARRTPPRPAACAPRAYDRLSKLNRRCSRSGPRTRPRRAPPRRTCVCSSSGLGLITRARRRGLIPGSAGRNPTACLALPGSDAGARSPR